MLKVNHITKKFGELIALDSVSFKVKKGECVGIIGPNGAGKTTLFNVVSGFLKPNCGTIKFNGIDITGKRPSFIAKLGLVRTFQLIKVFRNLTIEENLSIVTSDYKDILKKMGLWEKKDWPALKLSQGELRRLSICIALATKPKLLMLDEPFSGLDSKDGMELSRIISELYNDGTTLIIIEHKLKELFELAERIIVLNFGKIIFEGGPEEVKKSKEVINAYLGVNNAQNRESPGLV